MINIDTKARAHNIAELKRILPPQRVPNQLNTLIADGTAITIVESTNVVPSRGLIPDWNMWCPHTIKPRNPIPMIANTIAL
jgi:hypothetical protein